MEECKKLVSKEQLVWDFQVSWKKNIYQLDDLYMGSKELMVNKQI
jgi:hypothetical protein